jgi:hypothetical protein
MTTTVGNAFYHLELHHRTGFVYAFIRGGPRLAWATVTHEAAAYDVQAIFYAADAAWAASPLPVTFRDTTPGDETARAAIEAALLVGLQSAAAFDGAEVDNARESGRRDLGQLRRIDRSLTARRITELDAQIALLDADAT